MTTEEHLTASAVVFDPNRHQVLLVHHNATNKLVFPGGHVDPNEDPATAAIREVLEETGVTADLVGQPVPLPGMEWRPSSWLTARMPAPAKPDRGPGLPAEPPHTHIDLLYIATADSRQPVAAQLVEVSAALWTGLDELEGLPVRAEVPSVARLAWEHLANTLA